MLENRKLENNFCEPVHMSRFIASWANAVDDYYDERFEEWLKSLGIDERTIRDTVEMATCGKMELEMHARSWNEQHSL